MPRQRIVKPEIWTSEQFVSLTRDARLAFIGLLNFCDDGGVHTASATRLKMEVFPADELTINDIERISQEWLNVGLVESFDYDGITYWHVTGWNKHQVIDYPRFLHARSQEFADMDPPLRRKSRDLSGTVPGHVPDTSRQNQTKPNQTKLRETKPNQTKCNVVGVSSKLTKADLSDTNRVIRWAQESIGDLSDADVLNVIAAAERAIEKGQKNAPGLFVSLVKSRSWSLLTNQQIDRATARLNGKRRMASEAGTEAGKLLKANGA